MKLLGFMFKVIFYFVLDKICVLVIILREIIFLNYCIEVVYIVIVIIFV